MKKPQNHPAKIIVPLITIGLAMALLLILTQAIPERKHNQNSYASDNQLIIESFSDEITIREEAGDIMTEKDPKKSDTERMQRKLEELESAR